MASQLLCHLIQYYFYEGLHYDEILAFLTMRHNIQVSLRTVKRVLKQRQLFRRKFFSNSNAVIEFLQEQLESSGQLHGYRWMHLRCIRNGFTVTRDTVRMALQILDPHGVDIRRRRRLRRRQYSNQGPNFLWHLDSYYKLKPYGICINGCIDGFSRYIIWLRAGATNNDPKVIGGYYYESINQFGGCPQTIRGDYGTENGHVERFQIFLVSQNATTTKPPFMSGRSTANQRIESWWRVLRTHSAQFWMNIFQRMKEENLFDGYFLDKSLIQFCFMDLIESELTQIVQEWNSHIIRKSKNHISPAGKPMIMFHLPHLYGSENYLVKIRDSRHLEACKEECTFSSHVCDEDMEALCQMIMDEEGWAKASDPFDAVSLYENLRREVLALVAFKMNMEH